MSASQTRDEVTSPDTDIHSSLQVNICSFNGLVCVCVTYSKVQGFKSKHPSVLSTRGKSCNVCPWIVNYTLQISKIWQSSESYNDTIHTHSVFSALGKWHLGISGLHRRSATQVIGHWY